MMLLVFGLGIGIYLLIALAFFTLSAMELIETGQGKLSSLLIAFLTAVLWPVTLVSVSLVLCVSKLGDAMVGKKRSLQTRVP
ncbi:hypothetical protein ABLO27_19365 [Roseibium sp. SCPC15]|uniref:hypothetical protein n=1 Tax=Roseibium sp. SCP15 TaxID=3141376 RepID=UPI00333BCF9F